VGGKFVVKDTTQSRHWLKWRCNCEECNFEIAWKKDQDKALCTLVSLHTEHCGVITGSSYTYKQLAAVLQSVSYDQCWRNGEKISLLQAKCIVEPYIFGSRHDSKLKKMLYRARDKSHEIIYGIDTHTEASDLAKLKAVLERNGYVLEISFTTITKQRKVLAQNCRSLIKG
jgi:hypothetical protein